MAIKQRISYEANDGTLFRTREEAEAHSLSHLSVADVRELKDMIQKVLKGSMCGLDVVVTPLDTWDELTNLVKRLGVWV